MALFLHLKHLHKIICSSYSSSGVLAVPSRSSRSNPIFWRLRGSLEVLTPSCGVPAVLCVIVVLIRISATVISTHFIDTARPYENSSAKMFNSSYPERNFRGNQLLDASISLSPLYPSATNDLPVSIVMSFHQSFPIHSAFTLEPK